MDSAEKIQLLYYHDFLFESRHILFGFTIQNRSMLLQKVVAIDLKLSQFQMIKRLTCKFITKYT